MLSEAQIEQFERQGFLVLEQLIDERLLQRLEAEYDQVLERLLDGWLASGELTLRPTGSFYDKLSVVNAAGLEWFQAMDISLPMEAITEHTPFHMGPAVFDLLNYAPLLDIAESMLGPELVGNPIQHVRIKPPAAQVLSADQSRAHIGLTSWHQDRGVALAEADDSRILTMWVAVTDARVDNGCLTVIPGPIDDGLLTHCPAGQTHIPDSVLDKSDAVPVEVPRGSVLLLHASTPHASLANVSDRFRWSFDLRYHCLGDNSGRSHFPSFIVRSDEQPTVRDWQEMRDAWLQTRAKLAKEPHIALHRWSGDASVCA